MRGRRNAVICCLFFLAQDVAHADAGYKALRLSRSPGCSNPFWATEMLYVGTYDGLTDLPAHSGSPLLFGETAEFDSQFVSSAQEGVPDYCFADVQQVSYGNQSETVVVFQFKHNTLPRREFGQRSSNSLA
jgi:hypothetical protein